MVLRRLRKFSQYLSFGGFGVGVELIEPPGAALMGKLTQRRLHLFGSRAIGWAWFGTNPLDRLLGRTLVSCLKHSRKIVAHCCKILTNFSYRQITTNLRENNTMRRPIIAAISLIAITSVTTALAAGDQHSATADQIAAQNAALETNTKDKGFGPQSPRDLSGKKGSNKRVFSTAPSAEKMNLCNIHFHESAEHKGGEFTTFVGYGDGKGYGTGYKYNGTLSAAESKPLATEVCKSDHGGLQVGDTIEVHYVFSSAQVNPGPTLASCLSDADNNPQLRVEGVVLVLVNDDKAIDFNELAKVGTLNGYQQALNIPKNAGKPIQYPGSTTGPSYNEKGSPLQVSWSVRPKVVKVNANSVGEWCKGNIFKEDHAHGVRNLVTNEKLLSEMK